MSAILFADASVAAESIAWNADSTTVQIGSGTKTCIFRGNARIDTAEKHSGTGSMRVVVGDTQGTAGCDPETSQNDGNLYDGGETYFRWWMKIDPSFDWGPWQRKIKFARIKRSNDQNPTFGTLYLHSGSFEFEAHFSGSSSVNLSADFDPSGSCRGSRLKNDLGAECTQWREYIFYMKRQTCSSCKDGIARLYIDGQLADERTGAAFAWGAPSDGVTGIANTWLGSGGLIFPQLCENGSTCGAGGTLWIDDISTATEWNSIVQPRPNAPVLLSAQ